ncbi:hypothetical protein DHL47_02375 [Streptococcus panodentis]|uniref:Secreted protein n=1 Tax=Streptococcus panodentis TaxID=1581472 RepID=A0ABS5AUE6_9STRE|nr:hypothetical protein [Streptococcus panodentis]
MVWPFSLSFFAPLAWFALTVQRNKANSLICLEFFPTPAIKSKLNDYNRTEAFPENTETDKQWPGSRKICF